MPMSALVLVKGRLDWVVSRQERERRISLVIHRHSHSNLRQ